MAKRKKPIKPPEEAPTSSCVLLCQDVTISVVAGMHTLHGVVSEMHAPSLPITAGAGVVYVRFSNWYSSQEIILRFMHIETEEVVFQLGARSPAGSNPLADNPIIIRIPPFVLTRAGRYSLGALHHDLVVAESVITVFGLDETTEERP